LWAERLATKVLRGLPPSFELDDLKQAALGEHWKRCGLYDKAINNSYRGYAYRWIDGAIRMSVRRGEYREATHAPLPCGSAITVDGRENPEVRLLAREREHNVDGPRRYRQMAKLHKWMGELSRGDRDVLARWMDGREADAAAVRVAVARLKRLSVA
jgi:hypothetical protein